MAPGPEVRAESPKTLSLGLHMPIQKGRPWIHGIGAQKPTACKYSWVACTGGCRVSQVRCYWFAWETEKDGMELWPLKSPGFLAACHETQQSSVGSTQTLLKSTTQEKEVKVIAALHSSPLRDKNHSHGRRVCCWQAENHCSSSPKWQSSRNGRREDCWGQRAVRLCCGLYTRSCVSLWEQVELPGTSFTSRQAPLCRCRASVRFGEKEMR